MKAPLVIGSLHLVCACGAEPGPVTIGLITPLSGSLSAVGESLTRTVGLAVDDINAEGGVGGRPLEVISRDDRTDPDRASEVAVELMEEGAVALIGGSTTETVQQIVGVADGWETVTITPTASAAVLAGDWDAGWLFRVIPSDDGEPRALDHYAQDLAGLPPASFTIVRRDGYDAHADALAARWPTADVITYAMPLDDAAAALLWDAVNAASNPRAVFTGDALDANTLLRAWIAAGAPSFSWFLTTAARSTELCGAGVTALPAGVTGVRGVGAVFAESENPDEVFPEYTSDAVHLLAAALALHDADGTELRAAITAVSRGGERFETDDWAALLAAIDAGADVDLVGRSGSLDLDDDGEVIGTFEIWELTVDAAGACTFPQVELLDPADY